MQCVKFLLRLIALREEICAPWGGATLSGEKRRSTLNMFKIKKLLGKADSGKGDDDDDVPISVDDFEFLKVIGRGRYA